MAVTSRPKVMPTIDININAPVEKKSRRPAARKVLLFFACSAALLAAHSAFAQQPEKDLGDASLEDLANITVYTASRHVQKATEAPSSVSIITRDEIQKYGYRTLAEILQSMRGFDITYDGNFTTSRQGHHGGGQVQFRTRIA
jgi:outer membrane receptor for ferrienterochelin and colicin